MQDRVSKCKEDVQKTKERYEQALREINDYNAKYMEDMTVVFDKCQEFEDKRLCFFKEVLFGICACLNVSTDPEYELNFVIIFNHYIIFSSSSFIKEINITV